MPPGWLQFIDAAVAQEPDDPFVQLLRERLDSGCRVVRTHFLREPRAEYLVVLMCRQALSEMRIPHSPSFTRWSFGAGAAGGRMHTPENEAERFAILLVELLKPIEDDVGRDYLDAIVVEIVRRFGPPATSALLADQYQYRTSASEARMRIARAVEGALGRLAAHLVLHLGYAREQAAAILDHALASWLDRRLHISERQRLVPGRAGRG